MGTYNVKQRIQEDGNRTEDIRIKTVGGQEQNILCRYYIFEQNELGIGEEKSIIKFGYCCADNYGKDFPIYLKINDGDYIEFYPGKEGMYEFQPEKDESGKYTHETDVIVTGVKVPMGVIENGNVNHIFNFVLDYCFEN